MTRVASVWTLLVAATAISWFVGADHASLGATAATMLILVVAFVKVRLVGIHFMEIGTAPTWLRAAFEGYVAVVLTALMVLYVAL